MIAYNNLERIVFCIMINIGDALFAFVFGMLASIQLHISKSNEFQQFLDRMKQIEEFLVFVKAENIQRKKVEKYFSYSFFTKSKQHLIEQKDLESYLPYCLIKDTLYYASRDILSPMFSHFKSDNLIREVAYVLTNTVFMPGDFVILKDQIGEEMYFIVEGSVQVIAGDKTTVLKTLSKGAYFGEIALFMHSKRICYIKAKTFCVLSMLKKSDIDSIIRSYPQIAREFAEEAQKKITENTRKIEEKKEEDGGEGEEGEGDQEEDESDPEQSFIQALH